MELLRRWTKLLFLFVCIRHGCHLSSMALANHFVTACLSCLTIMECLRAFKIHSKYRVRIFWCRGKSFPFSSVWKLKCFHYCCKRSIAKSRIHSRIACTCALWKYSTPLVDPLVILTSTLEIDCIFVCWFPLWCVYIWCFANLFLHSFAFRNSTIFPVLTRELAGCWSLFLTFTKSHLCYNVVHLSFRHFFCFSWKSSWHMATVYVCRCAVCLGDYLQDEKIKHLPACNHCFHVQCIDKWLSTNLTCPICRTPLIRSEEIGNVTEQSNRNRIWEERVTQSQGRVDVVNDMSTIGTPPGNVLIGEVVVVGMDRS
jgi:hypothetical protein